LQLLKDESDRPSSTPAGACRFEQEVPQQRWDELQLGVHMPGGTAESEPPPSVPTPAHTPLTHALAPQLMPQPPQLALSDKVSLHEDVPAVEQQA